MFPVRQSIQELDWFIPRKKVNPAKGENLMLMGKKPSPNRLAGPGEKYPWSGNAKAGACACLACHNFLYPPEPVATGLDLEKTSFFNDQKLAIDCCQ